MVPFVTPDTSPGMMGWSRTMALARRCRRSTTALLLHGGADATSPIEITARASVKLMPHADLLVYEGAPHGIPYTHTDRLNRDLLTFVAG
jgi:non-heme chloroperoxidase